MSEYAADRSSETGEVRESETHGTPQHWAHRHTYLRSHVSRLSSQTSQSNTAHPHTHALSGVRAGLVQKTISSRHTTSQFRAGAQGRDQLLELDKYSKTKYLEEPRP